MIKNIKCFSTKDIPKKYINLLLKNNVFPSFGEYVDYIVGYFSKEVLVDYSENKNEELNEDLYKTYMKWIDFDYWLIKNGLTFKEKVLIYNGTINDTCDYLFPDFYKEIIDKVKKDIKNEKI